MAAVDRSPLPAVFLATFADFLFVLLAIARPHDAPCVLDLLPARAHSIASGACQLRVMQTKGSRKCPHSVESRRPFRLADVERALSFYRDALGFSVTFTNGEPVSFAVISQGERSSISAFSRKRPARRTHTSWWTTSTPCTSAWCGRGPRSDNPPRFRSGACAISSSPTRMETRSRSPNRRLQVA